MRYRIYETHKAEKNREKLEKGGSHIINDIMKAYEQLFEDPYYGSKLLSKNLRGKRSKRIIRGKARIEFAICEECRRFGYENLNKCVDCKSIPDNGIKIFDIFYRGRGY